MENEDSDMFDDDYIFNALRNNDLGIKFIEPVNNRRVLLDKKENNTALNNNDANTSHISNNNETESVLIINNSCENVDIESAEFVFLDEIPSSERQGLDSNDAVLEEQLVSAVTSQSNDTNSQIPLSERQRLDNNDAVLEEQMSAVTSESNDTNSQVEEININPENEVSSDNTLPAIDISDSEDKDNRKRKRNIIPISNSWKKNKNKVLRMNGKQYIGYRRPKDTKKVFHDTVRPERKLLSPCKSKLCLKAKNRFCSKISEDQRIKLHSDFWNDFNWDQRKTYIGALVDILSISRKRTESDESRRCKSFAYFLKIGETRKQVCKKMFLNTFNLGEWTVKNWVEQGANTSGIHLSSENRREMQKKTFRKPKKSIQKSHLDEFLTKIPKLPSHYCRKETSKQYLEPLFSSMTEFYNAYINICKEETVMYLSRQVFDDRVKSLNISLYKPKKDECDTCVKYKVGNLEEDQYKIHCENKMKAREEKQEDKDKGIDGKCIVLTVDLQAVKIAPSLNASALYYKTKLCVHNYTVYDLVSHNAKCYWWNEAEGELVASVFTTCLIDYISQFKDSGKPIIIWSDGCTYQNRNNIMACALLNFAMQNGLTIEQKYLERGHTQMECDSVHATIENKLKKRVINLPSDYVSATLEARKKPSQYEVEYLKYSFFKDYTQQNLPRYNSIRPGSKRHDPTVTDLRAINYNPSGVIEYKCKFDEPYQVLPQRLRNEKNKNVKVENLYKERLKIKRTKWQHLQELKSVLPHECHDFYDNLPHD